MKLIGEKTELPTPTGDWVLIRKEKRSVVSGLVLPDSQDSYHFFLEAIGPDLVADYWPVGIRVELQPQHAQQRGVMLDDKYALLPSGSIVGLYK